MKYSPVTEKEAESLADGVRPEGVYGFEITKAKEGMSEAGNNVLKLTLKIVGGGTVWDNITLTPKWAWKLRYLADSCDMLHEYEEGLLNVSNIVGARGVVKLRIQPATDTYKTKNEVEEYIKKALQTEPESTPSYDEDGGDIPF